MFFFFMRYLPWTVSRHRQTEIVYFVSPPNTVLGLLTVIAMLSPNDEAIRQFVACPDELIRCRCNFSTPAPPHTPSWELMKARRNAGVRVVIRRKVAPEDGDGSPRVARQRGPGAGVADLNGASSQLRSS